MNVKFSDWLPRDDKLSWTIHGVEVSPDTRTRREEYWWVTENILPAPVYKVLDVATGYVKTWHMLPYILKNLDYEITACDLNESTLKMPEAARITREIANMTKLPYEDNSFEVVCCISAIEHLSNEDAKLAAAELLRVASKQILVTADNMPSLPTLFGLPFDTGSVDNSLMPPVYALNLHL